VTLTKQTHSEVTAEAIKQAINIVDYQAGALTLHSIKNHQGRTTLAPANAAENILVNPALRL
jgi:hypothetical protein